MAMTRVLGAWAGAPRSRPDSRIRATAAAADTIAKRLRQTCLIRGFSFPLRKPTVRICPVNRFVEPTSIVDQPRPVVNPGATTPTGTRLERGARGTAHWLEAPASPEC